MPDRCEFPCCQSNAFPGKKYCIGHDKHFGTIDVKKRKPIAAKSDKPSKALIDKAQKAFNKFIRERDKDRGCISCNGRVEQAGHYFNQGQHSALRFNEVNVNGQCVRCNLHMHGNLINYRNGLVKKYGEQKVLLLESSARKSIKKWSTVELHGIIQLYIKK